MPVCGAVRDKYESLGGPTGDLGQPTRAAITTSAKFTRLGDQVTDFSFGSIYENTATHVASPAIWQSMTATGAPAASLATLDRRRQTAARRSTSNSVAPLDLPPGGCPPGTDNYSGTEYIYSCRNVFPAHDNYNVGLRIGFESSGNISGDDGDQTIIKGFGLTHAEVDHNVGPHSMALLVADTDGTVGKNATHPNRDDYQLALVYYSPQGAQIDEVITVVVQKGPDTEGNTPDGYDFGIVTAFCAVGIDKPGYPGYCSPDLPPPYNGGAAN